MRPFLLLLVFTSPALYATAFTQTSCTAGPTTLSPCPGAADFSSPGGISGPGFDVQAHAAVPSPYLSGDLSASVGIGGVTDGTVTLAATAIATDSVTFFTGGPLRPGFVSFDITFANAHADFPNADESVITDGIHRYENGEGAQFRHISPGLWRFIGTVPINLGSEFTASVSVNLKNEAAIGSTGWGGQERDASMSFSLSEAPVPEPSTWGLLILGLGVGAIGLFRRGIAKSRLDHDRDL